MNKQQSKRRPTETAEPKAKERTKGRAKGEPNREYEKMEQPPVVCKKCGATKRKPYTHKVVKVLYQNHPHRINRGMTHSVRRSCQCAECGQWMWVETFERRD